MDPTPDGSPRITDDRRSSLNDALTLAVGQGRIDLTEFSELSDAVWSTTDPERFARLEKLVSGEQDVEELAAKAAPAPDARNAPAPRLYDTAPAPVAQAGTTHWLNDIRRTGTFQLAELEKHTLVAADMDLDLREATLSAPVTVIDVTSYLGDIRITVPPGVRVDNRLHGILADVREDSGRAVGPSSPTVVLRGRSYGGDVKIRVRDHGEQLNRSWWSWLTG